MALFFAYGTLAPLDPQSAAAEGWEPDSVRGRLYDLGPYPALVDHEDVAAGWVEGYVRTVPWEQLTRSLDSYEGVDEGLYRRVSVRTRAGREVWLYVYARALPPAAIGPIDRWKSTKRVRFFTNAESPQGGH
jgi:gamma-glutamylcyclotransferase (GGCT)/AIG2-like uncharacterized protein YtfP